MPVEFLADVAVELDPRRADAVIARIPAERIVLISRELLRRREYVAMGRFVGHLNDDAVEAQLTVAPASVAQLQAYFSGSSDVL